MHAVAHTVKVVMGCPFGRKTADQGALRVAGPAFEPDYFFCETSLYYVFQ
jgi:hypothetical protein